MQMLETLPEESNYLVSAQFLESLKMDESFHDKIARICLNFFKSLPKSGKPKHGIEWTVLSCIVQENQIKNEFEIVALGTGSKCIGVSSMSKSGDILNDSHAEVICRRSFLRYLYSHIQNNSQSDCIFEEHSKWQLKSFIKFHFFTTHVPCGDATIFSREIGNDANADFGEILERNENNKRPLEVESDENNKRIKSDIYRTGAKCLSTSNEIDLKLPGQKYHILGAVRTKPGRGDPTASVSCSDKLSKWCHLGLQGALLSLLIDEPIYLSSFTILNNNPFNKTALERALYDRLGEIELSNSYRQTKLIIGESSLEFEFGKSDSKHPCPSSIIWTKTTERFHEVAVDGRRQGVTKKKMYTSAGRLKICKLELFQKFKEIYSKIDANIVNLTYREAKLLSCNYQSAWKLLKKQFKGWTEKDNTLLDISNE